VSEKWMVRAKDGAMGPYSTDEMRAELGRGRIAMTAFVNCDGGAYKPALEWPQLQGARPKSAFDGRTLLKLAAIMIVLIGSAAGAYFLFFAEESEETTTDEAMEALRELGTTWPDAKPDGAFSTASDALDKREWARCEAEAAGALGFSPSWVTAAVLAECTAAANRSGLTSYRERLLAQLEGKPYELERAALLFSVQRGDEAYPLLRTAYAADQKRVRTRLLLARAGASGQSLADLQPPATVPELLKGLDGEEANQMLQAWALESGELHVPFIANNANAKDLMGYASRVCRLDAPQVKAAFIAKLRPVRDALMAGRIDEAATMLGPKEDSLEWKTYGAVIAVMKGQPVPDLPDPLDGYFAAVASRKKRAGSVIEGPRFEELFGTVDDIATPNRCRVPFLEDLLLMLANNDPVLSELARGWRGDKPKKRLPGSEGALLTSIHLFNSNDAPHAVTVLSRYTNDEDAPRAIHALLGRAIERSEPAMADEYWAKLVEKDDDFASAREMHEIREMQATHDVEDARVRLKSLYLHYVEDKKAAPLEMVRDLAAPPKDTPREQKALTKPESRAP
jgi:hypothetical protein